MLETADQDTTAADFLAQDEFGGTASTAEDLHDQDVFLKEAFAKVGSYLKFPIKDS